MAASDPVKLIKDKLSTNWNSVNTDSVTPAFHEPDEVEKTIRGDQVRVYTGRPMTRDRLDMGADFGVYEASVSVDLRTNGTSTVKPAAHMVNMREEVERVLHANDQDPDSYWEFIWVDVLSSVEAEYATGHRTIMDIKLKRWGAIP